MGVKDVRLMNMGLEGWRLAGYALATDSVKSVPASAFGERAPESRAWIDSIDEVAKKLGTEGFTLVDNRTREEFLGKTSGYSYHKIAGRIEGAAPRRRRPARRRRSAARGGRGRSGRDGSRRMREVPWPHRIEFSLNVYLRVSPSSSRSRSTSAVFRR